MRYLLQDRRLASLRRRHDHARCPLPMARSDRRSARSCERIVLQLEPHPLVGKQRSQVLERGRSRASSGDIPQTVSIRSKAGTSRSVPRAHAPRWRRHAVARTSLPARPRCTRPCRSAVPARTQEAVASSRRSSRPRTGTTRPAMQLPGRHPAALDRHALGHDRDDGARGGCPSRPGRLGRPERSGRLDCPDCLARAGSAAEAGAEDGSCRHVPDPGQGSQYRKRRRRHVRRELTRPGSPEARPAPVAGAGSRLLRPKPELARTAAAPSATASPTSLESAESVR